MMGEGNANLRVDEVAAHVVEVVEKLEGAVFGHFAHDFRPCVA